MNFKSIALAVLLVFFIHVENVNAAGFALYEWGARGTAMGGTMIGRADDPSAVAYNPAGITQLEGTQTMVGFSVVAPEGKIDTPNETTRIKSNYWIPPHAFLTHQMTDKAWLGMGLYTRFGLGTEFGDDWEGRYNNIFTRVRSFSFNPNIAYQLTDCLSVAVGAEVMWFDMYRKSGIHPTLQATHPRNQMEVDGDSYGFGGNIGLHYNPNDRWSIGLTYKSRVKHTIKGDAKFKNYPVGWFDDTSAKGDITLPDSFGFGIMYSPYERLTLEANAIYTLWSTYKEFKVKFGDPQPGFLGADTISSDKKWKDVWRFQLGMEYDLNQLIDLRLGYVYDQIPDKDRYADYMTPTNDRHIINAGIGFNWEKASLDLSYSYLWFANRKVDNDVIGEAKFKDGRTHLTGVSFTYRF
ncbi:MAG: transporter [Desulfonatronovibrio sp. MSAO_Bac4]|nr:MAG: transporter [Desulfonatronovibrio sp. MSAO_Bac4]